jgi:NAD(P)-dependent dehydrogenase (short-subunit alcohol dehydrogenase family)
MTNNKTHPGKFALVTGASARVGKAIALHLAEEGYDIGLHWFTSQSEAESTRSEIEGLGRKGYLLQADLRQPHEIERMFEQVSKAGVNFALLVNSASDMPRSDLMEINWQEWDDIINLNLRAVWLMSQQAVRVMSPGGLILNISDAGATQQWTRYGAYVISKNGVNALTKLLAKQLAPSVRVNGIAPGLLLKPPTMTDEEWQKLAGRLPMRSAGDMDGFMSTIDLLISNEYITGEIITLNGGDTLG